jgi:hypothetical protein
MVLQQITVLKCVNGCPYIILGAGLVADMKPGLNAHLTRSSFSLWGKVPAGTAHTRKELWLQIQQISS